MIFKKEEYIGRLIVRYLKGELNDMEAEKLQEWRAASSGNEKIFQRMISQSYLDEHIRKFVKTGCEKEAEWQAIRGRTIVSQRINRRRWLSYAAVALLMLSAGGGAGYYLWERVGDRKDGFAYPGNGIFAKVQSTLVLSDGSTISLDNKNALASLPGLHSDETSLVYSEAGKDTMVTYHTLRIPRGGEYMVVLSDGSAVFLNAESELTYPVAFSGSKRKVYLKGEAYFNVRRDEHKPFVVEVDRLKVEVLGTTFGVRAYPDEQSIQTVLESGKVKVKGGGDSVVLVPSYRAIYYKEKATLAMDCVDISLFLGWKDGRLVYDNTSLEDILRDLGRWYAFDVVYDREEIRQLPFSLNIKKHETYTEVLQMLEETGKVQFEQKNNTVIVK